MTENLVPSMSTRVLRLRLKDKHAGALSQMAQDVNFVWNYSQDLALKVFERERRFLSAFDIAKFTRGATKAVLNLHSQTVQAASEEYVLRRKQFKKVKLRWRMYWGATRTGPYKDASWKDNKWTFCNVTTTVTVPLDQGRTK
jgi:hypothetical protein